VQQNHPYAMTLGASTILGGRIVKVDPRPGSLVTFSADVDFLNREISVFLIS
jgi:hypothetical protein